MMIFEIKHRFTGAVLFSLECVSLKLCVEAAIKSDANLSGADLRDADLRLADLRDADLRLADLRDANLRLADLFDADLRGADLRGADLRDANLSGADLRGADLRDANLRDADLTLIRDDLWAVLSAAPREVDGLRKALIEGRVDGSTYSGECACLVGTIANLRNVSHNNMDAIKPDPNRLIERFFMCIRKGDTPETNEASKLVVQWIDEFQQASTSAL